jgi:hypothetical protein
MMPKLFPWGQDYFVARVLLGFSEDEFWQSTPRKIHLLKYWYERLYGNNNKVFSPKNSLLEAQEMMNLLHNNR